MPTHNSPYPNEDVGRAAAIYRDIFYLSRCAIYLCHIVIQMCTGIDGVAQGVTIKHLSIKTFF